MKFVSPLLIQILLLAGWYTVPAMAAVPALVIFLPLVILVVAMTIFVTAAFLVHWVKS